MRQGLLFSGIVTLILCAPVLAYDWSTNPGDGSPENPYQISIPEQLISIGSDPNLYNTFKSFALTSDIVFDPNNNPEHVFNGAVIPRFQGSIDGRGFSIKNLRILAGTSNSDGVGLIGTYGNHGNCHLKNLNVPNAQITVDGGAQEVGILCGLNQLNIHNCQVSGTIVCGNGSTKIGGICGHNGQVGMGGIVTNCQSDISISSSSATGAIGECGGICGYNEGTIAHCSADGEINARTLSVTGGICGLQMYGGIISCDTSVDITAQRSLYYSGGLCGRNSLNGTISHSYATGNMTSAGTLFYGYDTILWVGGFCGHNTGGAINSCYSTGDVACGSAELGQGEESGGFCGRNSASGEIRDCFSAGDVICGPITGGGPRERWVGGFCGTNDASIINCYSTGMVDTDATGKAGFCYINYSTIQDSFWDTETSGILTAGLGGTISGVSGKTTTEMQTQSTFVGWDFMGESANGENEIWRMCADGVNTPRLSWEFAQNGDFACGDGTDILDLQALAEHWLMTEAAAPTTFDYACDANGDGVINLVDYSVLGENW